MTISKVFQSAAFFFLTSFAFPVLAETAGHHGAAHGSPFGKPFLYSLINFTILLIVLFIALRKPAAEFFRKRSTNTHLEMDKAKKYYDEAFHKYKEIDSKLKHADEEGRKLLDSLKRDGELEKHQILSHAQEVSQKIKMDSEKIVQQELRRAQEILKAETVNLAAELASRHLESSITPEDQKALAGEFIQEVQKF